MKNIVNLSRWLAAVLLLSVSACVKDPKPETPHPPAPDWLLTKIVASAKTEIEGGPVYYSVTVDEYEYNHHYKPKLHRQYFGEDSDHLVLRHADTLSYDNQLRPIRKGVRASEGPPYEVRYTYSGNDLYPTTVARYSDGSISWSYKFLYRDTIVYQIFTAPHLDTAMHVYNKLGNYIGTYDPDLGLEISYNEYDNHPNPARFLNLNFSWVLNIPEANRGPLYSSNNWLDDLQGFIESRNITYDAFGKVSQSVITRNAPDGVATSVYYYTKPDE
jgi:hypothetical protein